MNSFIELANYIQNGLNEVLSAALNGSDELQFRVWATAGERTPSVRDGNTVRYFIDGNLTSTSSSNEANILEMGFNGLSLSFGFPVQEPKTDAGQTAAALAKIQNSQYPFVDFIVSVIDAYFKTAQTFTLTDGDTNYGVGFNAGRSTSGIVDIGPVLGNYVTVSVYIEAYYLEGGINSRDVVLTVDGVKMPFQNVTIGRSNRMTSDQYSGSEVVKNLSTATALSIDFAFPANADNTTKQAVLFLLKGKPNSAHFVGLQYGSGNEETYFMTFDNMTTNAQGISFAGVSGSFIEVVENSEMLFFPEYFQIGRFSFSSSQGTALTFTVTETTGFIAGKAQEMNGAQSITLSPEDYEYDEDTGAYYVYFITNGAATVTDASATFEVVQEATNG